MSGGLSPAGVERYIHSPEVCAATGGYYCPFHRPSEHHMHDWQMHVRLDNGALVERICQHGIGHPDPDSQAFMVRETGDTHWGVHGCDGCCVSEAAVGREK